MKERPILFSGAMVRAILEGRKTVTRRLVKPQPNMVTDQSIQPWQGDPGALHRLLEQSGKRCPYGQPGDRLWVRETWARVGNVDPGYLTYRATYPSCLPPGLENVPRDIHDVGERWRPSIHMPRWACRLALEITAVRVERLQDISEEQAPAEGVRSEPCDHLRQACSDISCWGDTAKGAFGSLWESLNGEGSWNANPWVWVIEFKRVAP